LIINLLNDHTKYKNPKFFPVFSYLLITVVYERIPHVISPSPNPNKTDVAAE